MMIWIALIFLVFIYLIFALFRPDEF
ncbi:MAG: K(+)-transporting ATPase subunit F [Gammaproteobacteria bacterium]|nr:K(+)-transporting ATPase subunit F [Gammaproteobacteria bacterium]